MSRELTFENFVPLTDLSTSYEFSNEGPMPTKTGALLEGKLPIRVIESPARSIRLPFDQNKVCLLRDGGFRFVTIEEGEDPSKWRYEAFLKPEITQECADVIRDNLGLLPSYKDQLDAFYELNERLPILVLSTNGPIQLLPEPFTDIPYNLTLAGIDSQRVHLEPELSEEEEEKTNQDDDTENEGVIFSLDGEDYYTDPEFEELDTYYETDGKSSIKYRIAELETPVVINNHTSITSYNISIIMILKGGSYNQAIQDLREIINEGNITEEKFRKIVDFYLIAEFTDTKN